MNETILWGEVDKVGDDMFWCHGGAKLPKRPTVNGSTTEPFYLVSVASLVPNLNAISLDRNDVYTTVVQCLHSKEFFEKCRWGNRTKDQTALDKIMKEENISFNS